MDEESLETASNLIVSSTHGTVHVPTRLLAVSVVHQLNVTCIGNAAVCSYVCQRLQGVHRYAKQCVASACVHKRKFCTQCLALGFEGVAVRKIFDACKEKLQNAVCCCVGLQAIYLLRDEDS